MTLLRGLYALPLLLPTALMIRAMMMADAFGPVADEAYSSGRYTLRNGTTVPIYKGFTGIPGFDEAVSRITIAFGQLIFYEDARMWWQCLVFLADFTGLCAIFMLESLRNANRGTLFQTSVVPLFFAQFVALGNVAPSYLYLFYVFSPLKKYATANARLIDRAGMIAILPTLLVVSVIPHLVSLFHPDFQVRHLANFYWQLFPIWNSILLFILSSVIRLFLDDRPRVAHEGSKKGLRVIGGVMITLSLGSYWYMLLCAPFSLSELFVPKYLIEFPKEPLVSIFTIFQYDYILSYATVLLWLAYHFGDLKSAGICQLSWARILISSVVIGCLGGPGVLSWVGWLTREEMLASAEHAKTS